MSQQGSVSQAPDDEVSLPAFNLASDRHHAALNKLNVAYAEKQPAALLLGEGKHEFSHVIGAFLAGLGDEATVARLQEVCTDALLAMRDINGALGFGSKDLSLDDLKSILLMFLDYQRKHRCRTVICIEQAGQQPLWLLDIVAELVRSEATERYGLMFVLSGDASLDELLNKSSFEVIREKAGRTIRLAPFALAETREFLRQRIEVLGRGDLSSLFDFEAVDRLHKLSGGIPHTVGKLCQECLRLSDQGKNGPVSAKLVVKAARRLQLDSTVDMTLAVVNGSPVLATPETRKRLIVRYNGAMIQEMILNKSKGRFLVGRAPFANIYLPSCLVSRRHALIVKTDESVQIIDLASTNGICVAGYKVSEFTLTPGTVVTLGDCEIEFDVS